MNLSVAQWQQTNGPFGGAISSVAISGSTIFAGTPYSGLYRSQNNGTSWESANNGITDNGITALAGDGTRVFAGTSSGIFLSINQGQSWTNVSSNLANKWICCIALSGSNIYVGTFNGVHFSSDNGASWTPLNYGLPTNIVNALAVNGSTMFAGTYGDGVFTSNNGGASWNQANTGLPANAYVYGLAIKNNYVFAGMWYDGGIYRSSDNGSTWSAANSGLTELWVNTLYVHNNEIFAGTYNGLFKSTNDGASWSYLNMNLTGEFINSLAGNGSVLFCATDREGLHRSDNNGGSWTPVNNGIISSWVYTGAVKEDQIFISTDYQGIYKSVDNGDNWIYSNTGMSPLVTCLKVCGNFIFAATMTGVYRSTNGQSWTFANSGLPGYFFDLTLAVSDTVIYAVSAEGSVYRTINYGDTWTTLTSTLPGNTVNRRMLARGQDLFITGYGLLYTSHDGGTTWETVSNGLPATSWVYPDISVGSKLFAGTSGAGVYSSADNGATWSYSGMGNSYIQAMESYKNYIFAGTGGYGVYYSNNLGTSWTMMNEGLSNLGIEMLTVSNDYLIAGTYYSGAWKYPLGLITTLAEPGTEDKPINIFPNPAVSNLTVSFAHWSGNESTALIVEDIRGNIVYSSRMDKSTMVIDVRNYPSGIYVVKIVAGPECKVGKFIKE